MKFVYALGLMAALLTQAMQSTPTRQFEQFFPDHCSAECDVYLSETYPEGDNVGKSAIVTPVIDCILGQFPEFRKTELAASAVILGAMPSILHGLGSLTAETALLSLRRPFLAFFLAAASPAVVSMKGSEFSETLAGFVEAASRQKCLVCSGARFHDHLGLSSVLRNTYSLEAPLPTLSCLAINWVGMLSSCLLRKPSSCCLAGRFWRPAVIHIAGVITLHVRVKTISSKKDKARPGNSGFAAWTPNQFTPSALQPAKRSIWRENNAAFVALSWFLNVVTLAHVVFGTLIFSSPLFSSVIDAVTIVARYSLSAMVCRAVVRMELSGMGSSQATLKVRMRTAR